MPNYMNIVNAALNKPTEYMPLYEHSISDIFMEKVTGKTFRHLHHENPIEYHRHYCAFFKDMGYDTVSYECGLGPIMPGSGALGEGKDGVIKTRQDFDAYPWDKLPELYFQRYTAHFDALCETMPQGMKAIGGVGYGVFECVQDVVGFHELCLIRADDEELFADLFKAVGDAMATIWKEVLTRWGDILCVCRFGDDLGFKSATLLPPEDIREHIIPQYKRLISIIHGFDKPFLLHSCGKIDNVMEDIIGAGINAKHSNEDIIAPFSFWIQTYGNRIGNFGGLDTDALCDISPLDIEKYTTDVYKICAAKGHGVAIGSGNSIPEYVCRNRYLKAIEIIRKLRGE